MRPRVFQNRAAAIGGIILLRPKVLDVNPLLDYKLMVFFDSGEKKVFNVEPYISGDWFGKLKDSEFFKAVRIAGNTVVWPDGQDIAPHELYDYSVSVVEEEIV